MFTEGALLLERLAARPPRAVGGAQGRRRRHRRGPRHVATRDRAVRRRGLRRRRRGAGRAPAARPGHHRGAATRSSPTGSGRCSAPGTSSSPAPRVPTSTRAAARSCPAASAPPRSASTPSRRWASTSSTCRRSTRSDASTARAATTPSTPAPTTSARRGRSAREEGGHDAIHPDLGTVRGLRRVRRPRPRARPRGGARPRAAGGAGPPVGEDPPGVVHHPRGRLDRLRREPAEEVPGHLPDQLRQRPRGHLPRGAADRPAVDVARRARLPRGQPAHQAGRVLGVAARRGPQDRPRRPVPRRGVHQAGDDARPRHGRLPPVLHLLHLAHRQVGARAVLHRGRPRDRLR